jgi:hypothetical protein
LGNCFTSDGAEDVSFKDSFADCFTDEGLEDFLSMDTGLSAWKTDDFTMELGFSVRGNSGV